jgi:threonine dehydrogenase-like Zn-dependent dehydrogenase
VDPDRLSALVVLANYGREGNENVIVSWGAGCQTIGILAYREARSAKPRAVIGLTDLSARKYLAKQLGHDLMTFAAPFAMFQEMEANVPGSFLERDTWRELMGRKEG